MAPNIQIYVPGPGIYLRILLLRYKFMPGGIFYINPLDRSICSRKGVWVVFIIVMFMPPSSKKLEGHITSGGVRPSVRLSRYFMHSITWEPCMLLFWNFLYDSSWKKKKIIKADTYFFFLPTGLCPFPELWLFEKIWIQSCQQNISKTIQARAMKRWIDR